jgi:hypothetical protein
MPGNFSHPKHHQRRRKNDTRDIRGYTFVHYHHKAPAAILATRIPPSTVVAHHFQRRNIVPSYCAAPLADGAKWKTSRPIFIAGKNRQGLDEKYILEAVTLAADAWRCKLALRGDGSQMALGPIVGIDMRKEIADFKNDAPDGLNVIGFGYIQGAGRALAATQVYMRATGPISQREIIEADITINEEFRFGDASKNFRMVDGRETLTHEFGHYLGLDDVMNRRCVNSTMYASSEPGETKKRTPDADDIQGINEVFSL